ncbi:MAG TPA: FAD-dependent oxidoreductase, partial [Candidatus Thermoplasmatota archaeon]|nr:FAD-dependent oxidoreductase [Candidatus Thermoplasmatota archaeon]
MHLRRLPAITLKPMAALARAVERLVADVAVVGASAAGLSAARAAACEGARVVLLERRPEIGLPEAPAAVAFQFLWTASEAPPDACVRRRLDGVRLRSPGGYALEVQAPLVVLDRVAYDRHLARGAEEAGARVVAGVRGLGVRDDRTLAAEGLEVSAKVVVFADGARTLAARFLRPVRHPEGLTWGAAQR